MPRRPNRLGLVDPACRRERRGALPLAGARDADRPDRSPPGSALDGARAGKRCRSCEPARSSGGRSRLPRGSPVLRRTGRRRPSAAPATRGSAWRARRAGTGDFRQLRWLARPPRAVEPAQAPPRPQAARSGAVFAIETGGRWAILRRAEPPRGGDEARAEAIEHVARVFFARYGVVFWRLLARSRAGCRRGATCCALPSAGSPRGIRGGRFVAGFTGEQFALPEAVALAREIRRRPAPGEWVSLSGAVRSISLAS